MLTQTLTQTQIYLLLVAVVWSTIWKGLALWKAGRKNHLVWFVVLLIVNTLGILDALYLFIFSKESTSRRVPLGRHLLTRH